MSTVLVRKLNALACAVGVALVVSQPARAQRTSTDRVEDRQQITTILGRWEQAWNTHDMTAFASLFHEDGVWVLWTGAVWTGREAIEKGHAEAHRSVFRNSTQRERLEELTFIGAGRRRRTFCSTLTGDERSPDKLVRSLKVLVVTRRQGTWKVGWGQNTRLADTVPDSDCFTALQKAHGVA